MELSCLGVGHENEPVIYQMGATIGFEVAAANHGDTGSLKKPGPNAGSKGSRRKRVLSWSFQIVDGGLRPCPRLPQRACLQFHVNSIVSK